MSSKALKKAVVAGIFTGLGWSAQGASADAKAKDPGDSAQKGTKSGTPEGHNVSHGVPKGSVQCFGANSCKGQNGCAVTAGQITAANEAFGGKYSKSKPFTCAGQSTCAAKDGYLSWKSEASAADCFGKGGFMFERKDGKLIVKKS